MPLGMEVGLGPGDMVLDGNPAPKKGGTAAPLHFLANVYCGQTAGWIKMPLCTKVGLVPDHIVLDGDLTPSKRGHSPQFLAIFSGQTYPVSATAEHLFIFTFMTLLSASSFHRFSFLIS